MTDNQRAPSRFETDKASDIGEVTLYPPYREALKRLLQTNGALEYGNVLTHEFLCECLGIVYHKNETDAAKARAAQVEYMAQVTQLKRMLLDDRQIAIRSRSGVGYEVVPPQEQTSWALDIARRKIARAMGEAGVRLTSIRMGELSIEQAKENADARARLAAIAGMARAIPYNKKD